MSPFSHRARALAWLLPLVAAAVAWFPGLATLRELPVSNDIFCSDFLHLNLPLKFELAQALGEGRLPLWSPLVASGFPLLAEGQVGALYPPNWLLFGTLPFEAAIALSILLHFVLAGAATFVLLRDLDVEPLPALTGALAFAFSAFFVLHVKHLNMVHSAAWLPLALAYAGRGARRADVRWFLAAGAVLALQVLGGHVQIAWISAVTAAAYGAAHLVPGSGAPRRAPVLAGLVLMAVAMVGLAAAQVLPTLELSSLTARAATTVEWATEFAYTPRELVSFVDPYAFGDAARGTYRHETGLFWENTAYVGLVPLALALAGAVLALVRRDRRMLFFALAAALATLVSLGQHTPLFRLAFHVPGFSLFRFPQRFLLVTQLALAVLAAWSLQQLVAWLRVRVTRRGALVATACGLVVLAATALDLHRFGARHNRTAPASAWLVTPSFARRLAEAPRGFRVYPLNPEAAHIDLYTREWGWWGDLEPYRRQRQLLQPDQNLLWRVPSVTAYVALMPLAYRSVWGDHTQPGLVAHSLGYDGREVTLAPRARALLDTFSVRHVVSWHPIVDDTLRLVAEYGRYRLYENGSAKPRARIEDGEGEAELVSDEAHEVVVRARLDTPGLLVLADQAFPGWVATVDGASAAIETVHDTLRGVRLPPGSHEVRFRYAPRSFAMGAAISLVALLAFAVAGVVMRPRAGARE